MEKNARNVILLIVGALILTGVAFYGLSLLGGGNKPVVNGNRSEGTLTLQELADKSSCPLPAAGANLDDFAKCISSKGIKFYGAFWCPHCKDQKELFGESAQYLPYIECSTPDGNDQLQTCKDANITGYPTWDFSSVNK